MKNTELFYQKAAQALVEKLNALWAEMDSSRAAVCVEDFEAEARDLDVSAAPSVPSLGWNLCYVLAQKIRSAQQEQETFRLELNDAALLLQEHLSGVLDGGLLSELADLLPHHNLDAALHTETASASEEDPVAEVEPVEEVAAAEVEDVAPLEAVEVEPVEEVAAAEVEDVAPLEAAEVESVEEVAVAEVEDVAPLEAAEVESVEEVAVAEVEDVASLEAAEVEPAELDLQAAHESLNNLEAALTAVESELAETELDALPEPAAELPTELDEALHAVEQALSESESEEALPTAAVTEEAPLVEEDDVLSVSSEEVAQMAEAVLQVEPEADLVVAGEELDDDDEDSDLPVLDIAQVMIDVDSNGVPIEKMPEMVDIGTAMSSEEGAEAEDVLMPESADLMEAGLELPPAESVVLEAPVVGSAAEDDTLMDLDFDFPDDDEDV